MVQYLYLNDEEIQLSVNEILNMVNITLVYVCFFGRQEFKYN